MSIRLIKILDIFYEIFKNDKVISDEWNESIRERIFYSFSVFALKTFGEVLCFHKDQFEIFKEFAIRFHE